METNQNNSIIILLFFILLGVAWLTWKPLIGLILIGFFLKYWLESRAVIIHSGGYRDPKEYKYPENLLKCKICKTYFQKDYFQEHVFQAALKEQEIINEMPFLSFVLSKNRHQEFFGEALDNVIKSGGKYELDNDDGTKVIIKGHKAKRVNAMTGKVIKEIDLDKETKK